MSDSQSVAHATVIKDIDIADLRKITALVHTTFGYDFREYALSSFKRRILRILEVKSISTEQLIRKLTEKAGFIDEFIDLITVNTTEFFRDPGFWRSLRDEIIPAIRVNNKDFKVLHVGCSSGEEVLSMMILLKEMGIANEISVTATDLDTVILERARAATYPMKNMEINEKNYVRFGGKTQLKDYFEERNGNAIFNKDLLKSVSFKKFDFVTGEVSSKYDLILCRNIMIYFNQTLQNEVVKKFHASLSKYGYLAIGAKESIAWCESAAKFNVVNQEEKIYRKIKD